MIGIHKRGNYISKYAQSNVEDPLFRIPTGVPIGFRVFGLPIGDYPVSIHMKDSCISK